MTSRVRAVFERIISEEKEDRVRSWAAEHAYSLVFITFMFVVTWGLIMLDIFVGIR